MTEVLAILGGIVTSAQILDHFVKQTQRWRVLSDRLFDIKERLDGAEVSLENWQRKYDIQDRRPATYMYVLFGRAGSDRIQQTLGSIKIVSKTIKQDIDGVVDRALRVRTVGRAPPEHLDDRYDKELVEDCLRRIKRNTSWSKKFNYSVLGKADDIEFRLDRLDRKLTMLERFSDYFLEKSTPRFTKP